MPTLLFLEQFYKEHSKSGILYLKDLNSQFDKRDLEGQQDRTAF